MLDRTERRRRRGHYLIARTPEGTASGPEFSGPQTRYDLLVTGGEVNREEWAKAVQELIDKHTKGKKEPFARLVGVNPRTVHSWLDQATTVTERSVRMVAVAVGISPIELLIRVGVYSRDEMPAPAIPPEDEWIVEIIQRSNLSQDKKNMLIAIQLEQARREREERKRALAEHIQVIGDSGT